MNVDPRSSNGINISHLVCLSGCFTSLLPIPRPFLVHSYRFPMFHVHALLPPNCYIDLICYLDVGFVTGDVVGRAAYCGEVSLTLD